MTIRGILTQLVATRHAYSTAAPSSAAKMKNIDDGLVWLDACSYRVFIWFDLDFCRYPLNEPTKLPNLDTSPTT